MAALLAFFYGLIPNYAIAIALLTLSVMLVLSPLTLKSTRSMLAMQKLQPEMKRLQTQHKGDRQKLSEELMALYKQHNVNPAKGCIPMLVQMPVFIVMYRVIRGLSNTVRVDGQLVGAPKYLEHDTEMYRALRRSAGKMLSFGIDLASSAGTRHPSLGAALPYFVLVALVVVTQYYQTRQTMSRNPQVAANPQQQMLTKFMPGLFGLISLQIPAGVNVYFLVSALARIAQQGAMYRWDPAVVEHAKTHAEEIEAKAVEVKRKKRPDGGTKKPAVGKGPRAQAKAPQAKAPQAKAPQAKAGASGDSKPTGTGKKERNGQPAPAKKALEPDTKPDAKKPGPKKAGPKKPDAKKADAKKAGPKKAGAEDKGEARNTSAPKAAGSRDGSRNGGRQQQRRRAKKGR